MVIEEFLDGPEVSLFAVTDGVTAVPLMPAQDFKRARDGDQGPNTGGMGAYVPLPWAPADLADQAMAKVIQPAVDDHAPPRHAVPGAALRRARLTRPGSGWSSSTPGSATRRRRWCWTGSAARWRRCWTPPRPAPWRAPLPLEWRPGAAVVVVIAAEGYPGGPVKGDGSISPNGPGDLTRPGKGGQGRKRHAYLLHAGTARTAKGALVSAGGRVLNAVGSGPDVAAARTRAYEVAATVSLRGGWYRRDIAAAPVSEGGDGSGRCGQQPGPAAAAAPGEGSPAAGRAGR